MICLCLLYCCDILFWLNKVLVENFQLMISTLVHAIPVSFKLAKRKADENLQSLHTLLYGRKSNVRLPLMYFLISSFS
jgi:hypothetical protein